MVAVEVVKVHVRLILLTGIFNLSLATIDPVFRVPKSDTEYQLSFQNGSQIKRIENAAAKWIKIEIQN